MTYLDVYDKPFGRPFSVAASVHIGHLTEMDNNIHFWIKRRGIKLAALAAELDTSVRQVQRLRDGERQLTARWINKFAKALEVEPEQLISPEPESPFDRRTMRSNGTESHLATPDPASEPVLILGTARGALAGSMKIDRAHQIDSVARPPSLVGARDAYAIRIAGNSMSPEHHDGDLRFVAPHRPYKPGDTVLIQIREGGSAAWFIKHFVSRDDQVVVTTQLNPQATIEFRVEHVIDVHKVLTTAELFGV